MPRYEVVMNNPYAHSKCLECGASIDDEAKHDEFHQKFDELVEWAQEWSSYVMEEARPKSTGKMLGPNPGLLKGENE